MNSHQRHYKIVSLNLMMGDPSDENFVSYDSNYVCFDYAKNYSSILINNKCDFPIYTIHNKIEKYDGKELRPGEYFIDRDIIIPFRTDNGNPYCYPKEYIRNVQ
jgi:hypothetical protein